MISLVKQFIKKVKDMGMALVQRMIAERVHTNDAAFALSKTSEIFYGQISDILQRMTSSLERIENQLTRLEGLEITSQTIIKQEIEQDKQILQHLEKSEPFIPSIEMSGTISNTSKNKKIIRKDLSKIASKIKE